MEPCLETHPIIQCIIDNNLEELTALLKDNGINQTYPCIEYRDDITPLIASVVYQKSDICTFLLQNGANPDTASKKDFTPLHYVSLSEASLFFVEKLLEAKANPDGSGLKPVTPLHTAIMKDRKDVLKALISAGTVVTWPPYTEPEDTPDFDFIQILREIGDSLDSFLGMSTLSQCSVVSTLLCSDMHWKSPDEVFNTVDDIMLQEHPKTHLTMIETLFNVTGPEKEKYRQRSIQWLENTDNVETYIKSVVRRFPNIAQRLIPQVTHTLYKVLCTIEEIEDEQARAMILLLLEQLDSKIQLSKCDVILKTLYVITQKTQGKHSWEAVFIEKICRSIVPFVNERHSAKIKLFTYGIFGNLLSVENAVIFITSAGITSVPDEILTSADMKMLRDLKNVIRRLKNQLSESNLEVEDSPGSKKQSDKQGDPNEDKGCPAEAVNTSVVSVKPSWLSVSKRWQKKLSQLLSTDESKVTRIGSMIYVNEEEFSIAEGSNGTEVFLGLRYDGTEVAIKRMSKRSYKELKNEEGYLRLPELDHPFIVRYIDFSEDGTFGYLGVQLCEYTLEEYISSSNNGDLQMEKLVKQVLKSLRVLHCQDPPILHRDLKPQNILIDVTGRAKLADFGISRRLPKDQTTYRTGAAGTKCWMAKEALVEDGDIPYKSSTDIQVAGMLIYYILSRGHHPFGDRIRQCENNIEAGRYTLSHVEDVVAKDLIERMINEEPGARPTVEECLSHPFFWKPRTRENYLIEIGDQDEVKQYDSADPALISSMEENTRNGSFREWRTQFSPELLKKVEGKKRHYAENILGLLRFSRNLFVHYKDDAANVDLMALFPDLFGCIFIFAKTHEWNTRPSLKRMFETKVSKSQHYQ
ncbi:uncharacterized protein LOC121504224 [Cheilinus undulatus]|uniref:uncharacterized protein LOC121504224 n=1 Tax=Cheilinus undulatus TaxID=241271 RepID=UPI001BD5916C|nr:uncharacterized protein LOC121504224 [Cheilinus undulatus]